MCYDPRLRLSVEECLQYPWLNPWWYVPWSVVSKDIRDAADLELKTRPENNPIQAIALAKVFERYLGDQSPEIERLAYILKNLRTLKNAKRPVEDLTEDERIAAVLARLPTRGDPVQMPRSISQSDRVPYCVDELCKQLDVHVAESLAKDPIFKKLKILRHRAKLANRQMRENSQENSLRKTKVSPPKLELVQGEIP